MQQAIYNNLNGSNSARAAGTGATASRIKAAQTVGVLRWASRKWDLVGVIMLMGSSAAYGVFALAHLGL